MKQAIAIVCLLCLLLLSPLTMADENSTQITLRGWTPEDGYQYIQLGYYPYYSDGSHAPVIWRVLSVNKNVALLQSAYALDAYEGNKYSTPYQVYENFFVNFECTTQFERLMTLSDSILSSADLCQSDYGFDIESSNSRTRSVPATPYAAKMGLPTEGSYVSYWTYEDAQVKKVTPAGSILPVSFTSTLGIVPTITIGVNKLDMDKGDGTFDNPYANSKNEISLWLKENMFFDFEDSESVNIDNYNRRTLKTYTGPGTRYYRVSNSQINSRTASVRVLAREGSWYMIEYTTGGENDKKFKKTAWIHESDMTVSHRAKHVVAEADYLPEFKLTGRTIEATDLYDDIDMIRDPLYTLWKNQSIKLLGYTMNCGYSMAYIETEIYDKPVRGFVPLTSIELDAADIDQITNMLNL